MVEERCEKTDLFKFSCAHCRGDPDVRTVKIGELYRSLKISTCSFCGRVDPVGERISTDGQGGHLCLDCHNDAVEELK